MGLTPFLLGMIRTPPAALATANVEALAAKYGVRPDYARFYLQHWIARS